MLTANPEPLAPFLDAVLLGDGEELLPIFIDNIRAGINLPRAQRLHALAKIPGIYIPALYMPQYDSEGNLKSVDPITPDIPAKVSKQTWRNSNLACSTVITPDAAWPEIYMLEVARGCPELCRFCLASYSNLPFRAASLQDALIPAVERGLAVTKRLGLLGASVTQHPQFNELLCWLDKDHFDGTHVSISSVRASTVTPELGRILAKRGSKSLTIAIESGSDRIRRLVNKKLEPEEIVAAAHYARDAGLSRLKIYGMVGLPTEEESDIEATAELLLRLKKNVKGLHLTLSVSTFVPKAHTPFQWQGVRPEAEKRLKILAKYLKPKGISLRAESYGWSLIQALLARSDRRLAPVIATVRGSQESLGGWKRAYRAVRSGEIGTGPDLLPLPPAWEKLVHEDWPTTSVLPWLHITGHFGLEILAEQRLRALEL
ncbi:radical SAM protein [cyanobiont of Ornithocercus magnificus]|nr:radical SAM protein [cyanobiont of Ornithocercus magnificus]